MASVAPPRADAERGRAPMVAVSVEQWQTLLFRLDRLEAALQSVTQELHFCVPTASQRAHSCASALLAQ